MIGSEKYYDLLASVYDKATELPGSWNPPDIIYDNIKGSVYSDSRILDIGIGTGRSIDRIHRAGKYKEIYGVDASAKMLDICKDKYPDVKLAHVSSIGHIANIAGYFDIVISSGTLEFVEHIDVALQHVRCKQKKGGIFAFTYEPIIYFHPFQNDRKSLTVSDKANKLYIPDFYTYRHEPHEILRLLDENDYKITRDGEFIAYKKGEEKIIYHIVMAISN